MLLNHTKPITKQEERKRAAQRLLYFPPPRFVVFYNGTEDIPDRMELKLSDAFETKNGEPELELKVQVYNINRGKNEDLKERCPILKEYMIYVEKVREYVKLMPLEMAEKVGYQNQSKFAAAFKREYALSPRQYRLEKSTM